MSCSVPPRPRLHFFCHQGWKREKEFVPQITGSNTAQLHFPPLIYYCYSSWMCMIGSYLFSPHAITVKIVFQGQKYLTQVSMLGLQAGKRFKSLQFCFYALKHAYRKQAYLPPAASSCGWAPAVFLCERRSDPPGLLLGRLDIGTSLLKGHTLSRHYHSLKEKRDIVIRHVARRLKAMPQEPKVKMPLLMQKLKTKTFK